VQGGKRRGLLPDSQMHSVVLNFPDATNRKKKGDGRCDRIPQKPARGQKKGCEEESSLKTVVQYFAMAGLIAWEEKRGFFKKKGSGAFKN